MKIYWAQILFDLIGMHNVLIKFMNAASRKSNDPKLCNIYVNISLESRIFLEQLNAEINVQRRILNDSVEINSFESLRDFSLLEGTATHSDEIIRREAKSQLAIFTRNYSNLLRCQTIAPTTFTLLTTQHGILEKYLRNLR